MYVTIRTKPLSNKFELLVEGLNGYISSVETKADRYIHIRISPSTLRFMRNHAKI